MSEVTSYEPGVPSWVDLMTSDPEGARAFYGELFGWEFDIGGEETMHYTMCRLRGHNVAGMGGSPAPEGMPTAWTTYLASDDVDRDAKRISDSGGRLMTEPMDIMAEGRMLVGTDSTGAVFGLWQAGNHVGATLVNEPSTVTWNELSTRDLAAAMDFYTKIAGYRYEAVDMGDGPSYQTIKVGDRIVGGMLQMDEQRPAEVPAHWTPYFGVSDTDAAVATVQRLGGQQRVPPTDSPYGRFAVVTDPQGGAFTVVAGTGGS